MNQLKATIEHKSFIVNCVNRFNTKIRNCSVYFYSKYEQLYIDITGRKKVTELRTLFLDIVSLLFIYLGSSPKLCELIENNQLIDVTQFSPKYTPSKMFYRRDAYICAINKDTLNEKVVDDFLLINKTPIASLQYLLCEDYDKMASDHKITLLLHIVEGLVSKKEIDATKKFLCKTYPQKYHIKNIGTHFPAMYYLCKNYFFNYHRKYGCAILPLLKTTQLKFVHISSDTRNWYSHFLEECQKPNRLKQGVDMLYWFDILQYAIRIMIISKLKVPVDEEAIKEYYYILHDWILSVKYNRNDDFKSNIYRCTSPLCKKAP